MSKITVAGLELEHPIMNAAGTCKSVTQVKEFAASRISAVVVGSYKLQKRRESPGASYIDSQGRYSLNSKKLPSGGRKYLERHAEKMRSECWGVYGKPLILNIAGETPEEFGALAKLAVKLGFSAIEVNLSCPTGPAPICYQREPTALVVNAVNSAAFGKLPILYKLGYMPDPVQLKCQVDLIVGKGADGLVLINTLGGGLLFQRGTRMPVMRSQPMGVGGPALLPLGVGMVAQVRALTPRVDIIGVGGITTITDVEQYLAAGAKAVQAGTMCWAADRDPRVYNQLVASYIPRQWS
jgi:dihydroorotate dehydrogenase (fumarate)